MIAKVPLVRACFVKRYAIIRRHCYILGGVVPRDFEPETLSFFTSNIDYLADPLVVGSIIDRVHKDATTLCRQKIDNSIVALGRHTHLRLRNGVDGPCHHHPSLESG